MAHTDCSFYNSPESNKNTNHTMKPTTLYWALHWTIQSKKAS